MYDNNTTDVCFFVNFFPNQIDRFTDELEALKENLWDVFGEGWEAEGGGGEGVRVEGLESVGDVQQLREDTLETEEGIREVAGRAKVRIRGGWKQSHAL